MNTPPKLNTYNTKVSTQWGTPPDLYAQLNQEFQFNCDPCPLVKNPEVDGLTIPWHTRTFINPPYDSIEPWAKKCRDEQLMGNLCVLLIPSRTSTKYFHKWVLPYAEIRFIEGRLKFLNQFGLQTQAAPFASLLAIYRV
jgi:hypothetical protein